MKKIRYLITLMIFCLTFTSAFSSGQQKLEQLKQKYLKVNLNTMSIKDLQTKQTELKDKLRSVNYELSQLYSYSGHIANPEQEKQLLIEQKRLENELKPIEEQLSNRSKVLAKDLNFMNIYNFFTQFFKDMFKYIGDVCKYLLRIFFMLELINLLMNKPSEIPINNIAKLILKTSILYFLISNWEEFFAKEFLKQIERIAHYITYYGDKISGNSQLITPDKIWSYYSSPIISSFKFSILSLGMTDLLYNIVLLVGLLIIAFITIEYFMGVMEFYFMLAMSTFLLPFCIWQHTASIGTRIVGIIAYQFFKMLTMVMFLKVGFALIPDLTGVDLVELAPGFFERWVKNTFFNENIGKEQTAIAIILAYVFMLYIIKVLISKANSFANILVGGGSSLSSSDVTNPIGRTVAVGLGAALVAIRTIAAAKTGGVSAVAGGGLGKLANATKNQIVGDQKKDGK